jgi:hypothetical protein
VGNPIAPKMKENLVLLTRIGPKIINVKGNITRCHNKFENPIRNGLRSKMNHTPSQCCLQYEANRFLIQFILATSHQHQQKEFLETGDREEIHIFPKMIMNGRLDPNPRLEIETWELHGRRDERRKMQYLSSRSWEELSQIEEG